MIEIYKCTNDISPAVLSKLFKIKEVNYNLRIKNALQIPKVKIYSYDKAPYCLEVVF